MVLARRIFPARDVRRDKSASLVRSVDLRRTELGAPSSTWFSSDPRSSFTTCGDDCQVGGVGRVRGACGASLDKNSSLSDVNLAMTSWNTSKLVSLSDGVSETGDDSRCLEL